jgi:PAS domain S-box-containing protein
MAALGIFQLVTLFIDFSLFLFVVTKFNNSKQGKAYAFIIAGMTVWALSDVLTTFAPNAQFALFCEKFGESIATFVGLSILRFVLAILYPRLLSSKIKNIFFFTPSLIFTIVIYATNFFSTSAIKRPWGYDINHTSIYPLLGAFVGISVLTAVIILIKSLSNLNNLQKTQMKLFVLAFLIPLIGGTASETIAPALSITVMPLTTVLSSMTSIIIVYAIKKYEFLSVTPSLALEKIFDTIHDALISVDFAGNISVVNNSTKDMTGFSKEELVGKSVLNILRHQDGSPVMMPELTGQDLKDSKMSILSKGDKIVPVLIDSAAILTDKNVQGYVLVAKDMTQMDELVHSLENRTKELEESRKELETNVTDAKRLNEMMIGRELKMIELKKRIAHLEESLKNAGVKFD